MMNVGPRHAQDARGEVVSRRWIDVERVDLICELATAERVRHERRFHGELDPPYSEFACTRDEFKKLCESLESAALKGLFRPHWLRGACKQES